MDPYNRMVFDFILGQIRGISDNDIEPTSIEEDLRELDTPDEGAFIR